MHKKLLSTLFAGIGFLTTIAPLCPIYAARGDIQQLYQGQTIDEMVIKFMEENHVPGLSMAIVQAPYITRIVGYGLADINTKRLIASNTVFNLGQMTTAYTAIAIMQLKEAGKLSLTDPISKYVVGLPSAWNSITLYQLMTHSSSLPNYTNVSNFDYSQNYSSEQIIDLIKSKTLLFKPGTQVAASATDFYLLGKVVEKTSGMSYENYVTKNEIERAKLQHTFFASTVNSIKNEVNNQTRPFKFSQFKHDPGYINPIEPAIGYTEINGQLVATKPNSPGATFGNANVFASAEDVSIWDIALAGDILVKDPKDRDFLYNSITLDNGTKVPANVGWQFPGHPGLMYIEGNVPGYTSFLSRFTAPSELICVTLLTNKDNVPNLEVLGRKIAAAYDAKLATPAGAAWAVTRQGPYSVKETLDRFVNAIQQQGGKVFARIDQSSEAIKAGQNLSPTEIVVIGNPSKGTALMQANPAMALDLPLRAMAWRDNAGQVWLSFTNPLELGKAYNVQGQDALLKQMYYSLSYAAKKATSAY